MLSKAIKSQMGGGAQNVEEIKEQLERIDMSTEDIPQDLIDDSKKEFAAVKADTSLSNGESIFKVYQIYKNFERRYSESNQDLVELNKQRRQLYPDYATKEETYKKVVLKAISKINQLQRTLFYEAGIIFGVPLKYFETMFL